MSKKIISTFIVEIHTNDDIDEEMALEDAICHINEKAREVGSYLAVGDYTYVDPPQRRRRRCTSSRI